MKSGASNVTTLEYHRIISHVPNLYSLHPSEVGDRYTAGLRFDFIFTFSSLEHNGLGRWGDPINPSGDLEDFARCHCLLKDDGILFLGIPVGRDEVVWNAHRIYGRFRLSLALQNWKLLDIIGPTKWNKLEDRADWADQPIFVLQKKQFLVEDQLSAKIEEAENLQWELLESQRLVEKLQKENEQLRKGLTQTGNDTLPSLPKKKRMRMRS